MRSVENGYDPFEDYSPHIPVDLSLQGGSTSELVHQEEPIHALWEGTNRSTPPNSSLLHRVKTLPSVSFYQYVASFKTYIASVIVCALFFAFLI